MSDVLTTRYVPDPKDGPEVGSVAGHVAASPTLGASHWVPVLPSIALFCLLVFTFSSIFFFFFWCIEAFASQHSDCQKIEIQQPTSGCELRLRASSCASQTKRGGDIQTMGQLFVLSPNLP